MEKTVDQYAAEIFKEILGDIEDGVQRSSVAAFPDLYGMVDANEYLLNAGVPWGTDIATDKDPAGVALHNAVTDAVTVLLGERLRKLTEERKVCWVCQTVEDETHSLDQCYDKPVCARGFGCALDAEICDHCRRPLCFHEGYGFVHADGVPCGLARPAAAGCVPALPAGRPHAAALDCAGARTRGRPQGRTRRHHDPAPCPRPRRYAHRRRADRGRPQRRQRREVSRGPDRQRRVHHPARRQRRQLEPGGLTVGTEYASYLLERAIKDGASKANDWPGMPISQIPLAAVADLRAVLAAGLTEKVDRPMTVDPNKSAQYLVATDKGRTAYALLKAAQATAKALAELENAWTDATRGNHELDERLAEGYPFTEDLQEVVMRAMDWSVHVRDLLIT